MDIDDCVSTGELSKMLGFHVPVELLLSLGCTPAVRTKIGTYWRKSDRAVICVALASHCLEMSASHVAKSAAA